MKECCFKHLQLWRNLQFSVMAAFRKQAMFTWYVYDLRIPIWRGKKKTTTFFFVASVSYLQVDVSCSEYRICMKFEPLFVALTWMTLLICMKLWRLLSPWHQWRTLINKINTQINTRKWVIMRIKESITNYNSTDRRLRIKQWNSNISWRPALALKVEINET